MERSFSNIIYKYSPEWDHKFLSAGDLVQFGELLASSIRHFVPADLIEIYFSDENKSKLFYSSLAASDKRENKISRLLAAYVALSQDAFRFPYYDKEKYPDIKYSDVLALGSSFVALPIFYNHICIGSVHIASSVPQIFRDDVLPILTEHISRWAIVYKTLFAERERINRALQTLDYMQTLPHPVFAVDKECKLMYFNTTFSSFIQEHYKGKIVEEETSLIDFFAHDFPEIEMLIQEAWRNGIAMIEKNYLIGGKEEWYEIEAYKLNEQVLLICRLLEKASGIELREEQSFYLLYEQLPFAVILANRNSEIVYHNSYLRQTLGKEVSGSSLLEYIPPTEIKKYFRLITDVLHGEQNEVPLTLQLSAEAHQTISFAGYFKRIQYRGETSLVFYGTDMLKNSLVLNDYLAYSHKDVFDALPLGVLVADEQLSAMFINKIFKEITDYELNDIKSLPVVDILFKLDEANELIHSISALQDAESLSRILRLDTKFNKEKKVLFTACAYTSERERRYLLSIYDITALEEEKQKITKQAQAAIEAQQAEEQFLAQMSHEIRTAMNGIIGLTNVMMQSSISGEQRQFLNLIKQSTDNLLVIINDILDLSKIKSGKMQFETVPVQLKVLFENIYSIILSKLGAREVHLKMDFDEQIPLQLDTDPTRINQMLLNLIGNAIKFTERGQITYSAKLLGRDEETARILIEVADTGIGIDENSLTAIFDSYKQAEAATTRKYGGTGLGLPIVKQLVELMGGHISVRSQVNKGTTFSIELPLQISREQIVAEDSKKVDIDVPQGIRVLVVDDNYINRLLVAHLLKSKGFEVLEASGGYEALDLLQEEDVDVVLMDISMPDIDGFETTRIIRRSEKAYIRKIPVIAMTAHGYQDQIKNAHEAGMNSYIVKPFKPEQLYTSILEQLNVTQAISQIQDFDDVPTQTGSVIEEKLYDLAFLEDYYNQEPEFINHILKLYIQDTPSMLQEMTTYVQEKNWKQFKALAHKIKTNTMMMGIKGVQEFFKASSAMNSDHEEHAEMHLAFNAFKHNMLQALEQIKQDRKLN